MEDDKVYRGSRAGKIFGGLFVVGIGVLLILRQTGMLFPHWVFTWQMLLVGIGLFIGITSGFRNIGWLIVALIGGVFLFEEIYPGTNISPFIWPGVVIIVGLFMIFTPRHRHGAHIYHRAHKMRAPKWHQNYSKEDWEKYKEDWEKYKDDWKKYKWQWRHGVTDEQQASSGDDYVDSVAVFGGIHKVIVSKNFKGGDIVNICGGTELNLSQADFTGKVYLEVTQVFGGTKLIVPSNWEVRCSEMVAVFGSVEDKRSKEKIIADPEKMLIITGTSIFGGMEIISY
jgi:predicted membrane protein